MELLEHQSADGDERSLYLLRVARAERQQDVPFPLARITTCGTLTIEVLRTIHTGEGGQPEAVYGPPDATLLAQKGASTAFTLLALLASQPGNFATKDWLSEKLGHLPKDEDEDGEGLKRVDNVVTLLRKLLYPARPHESWDEQLLRRRLVAYQRASGETGPSYRLTGMPLLWLDVAEIDAHVKRARALEQFGTDGLAEWQAVYELASRGRFLPGEVYSDWAEWRRHQVEAQLWDCVQALWRRYVGEGEEGEEKAILILRDYWQSHVTKEDALRPLLELLGKREWYGQAEEYYAQLCVALEEEDRQPDRRTQETMEFVRALKIRRQPHHRNAAEAIIPRELLSSSSRTGESTSPNRPEPLWGIMLSQLDSGGQGLNHSRRQIISGMLTGAYTILTLSPYMLLQSEKQGSQKAHETPLTNKVILDDLEEITKRYWKLSTNFSISLLSGIQGHFQNIIQLLNMPQTPTLHRGLLSLASETAQLLGKTLFDLRDYPLALSYYTFAVRAALEAHNYDLWAVALGRISLLLISTAQPQQAISYLHEIRNTRLQSQKIRSWCAAIEAEAYSYLHHTSSCLNALERAKDATEALFSETDPYATGFTQSRLLSYEGSCYLRLHQPERALPVLQQAMTFLDPASFRKRSRLLTYMGEAHILLGDEQQACAYAHQALDLTQQTQSLDILHQVQALSDKLIAITPSSDLQDLNQRLQQMRLVIATTRGVHE